MADHTIIILGKRRPPKVVPPVLLGDQGDTVRFEARGTRVQIKFWKWPFKEDEAVIDVDSGAQSDPRILKGWEEDVDEYPYSVFCSDSGELAFGGSEPGIIIRRPSRS